MAESAWGDWERVAPEERSGPSLPGAGWGEATRRSLLSRRLNNVKTRKEDLYTKHVVA